MSPGLLAVGLSVWSAPVWAQEEPASDEGDGWGEDSTVKTFDTRIYGFINTLVEAEGPAPVRAEGGTEWEAGEVELDIPNLHVMFQSTIAGRYRFFLNLASPGSGGVIEDEVVVVRNAWVELPLIGERLQLRAGKTYRRFGLYNEILDAVPTFIGIEPPELFDEDHLMVTRTTNLMLHGSLPLGSNLLMYAVTSGNDERSEGAVPLGADVRVDLGGKLLVGSSFYTTGGAAEPGREVGEGSPRGGVANWMEEDRYVLYGGFAQLTTGHLLVQAEYWRADHDATRDPEAVAALAEADLHPAQVERFADGPDVSYAVQTAYVRTGYDLSVGHVATVTPYLQGDWYSNPETIFEEDFGGDGEAGESDDGQVLKSTAGFVFRPVPQVALKVEGSAHHMQFDGEGLFEVDAGVSLSYLWDLGL